MFERYTDDFDHTNLQIRNKICHSWHVAENCERIAGKLNADVNLAWFIGVIHDIGRFEQIRQIQGYTDSESLDHAGVGRRVLFDDGMIRQFVEDDSADEIISKAVLYHNRYALPDDLTQEELLYCNMIRDADKIDNFRGFHENDFYSFHERTPEEVQSSVISDAIVDCFRLHQTIPFKLIQTAADFFLLPYALYFGIVYPPSLALAGEQGNYHKMLEFRFQNPVNAEKFETIKAEISAYMERVE